MINCMIKLYDKYNVLLIMLNIILIDSNKKVIIKSYINLINNIKLSISFLFVFLLFVIYILFLFL